MTPDLASLALRRTCLYSALLGFALVSGPLIAALAAALRKAYPCKQGRPRVVW